MEAGDAFQEVEDVLHRHATLEAASVDLQAAQAAAAAEAERLRASTAAYIREHSAEVLELRNRLEALRGELEAAEGEAAALEAAQEYSTRLAAAKVLESGQLRLAAANLYRRVLTKSCVARPEDACPAAQLEAVGCFVGDMRAALRQHGLLATGQ